MRKKGVWFYLLAGLAALALAWHVSVLIRETQILIDRGTAGYRLLMRLSGGAAALLLAAWGTIAAAGSLRARKSLQRENRDREEKAALSYKGGRLDEETMRSMIAQYFRDYNAVSPGGPESVQFRTYMEQMDGMNACQARLHTLLELNGASDLNQTEDMMDALEQNLFMNLRKAINWANTANPRDRMPQDLARKLRQIEQSNGELLGTARELLTQLTDYINHQGDSRGAEETAGAFIEQLRLMIRTKEEE